MVFDSVVLERMMDVAPPGLDEVMALTRILEFVARDSYDLFVLDCASTGHLIRLLELPDLVNQWLKAFFNLFLKYQRVLRLPGFTERLVGISRSLKKLRELLQNPATSVLYAVSIPTQMALEETKDLVAACHRMGIAVPLVFLNLMTPPCDCRLCSSLRRRERLVVRGFPAGVPGETADPGIQTAGNRRAGAIKKTRVAPVPARQTGAGQTGVGPHRNWPTPELVSL